MSTNNNIVERRKNLPDQIDSTQFVLDIQLNLIYFLEGLYSYLKIYAIKFWLLLINYLKDIYSYSVLYSLVFKLKTYFLNNENHRNRLMLWLRKKLPEFLKPRNFNEDWRDGIRLCALCESIVPGCCPRYDLLDLTDCLNNLKLALFLIRNHLNIETDLTEVEIYGGKNETKLIHLFSRMKIVSTKVRVFKSTGAILAGSSNVRTGDGQKSSSTISESELFNSFAMFFEKCSIIGMGTQLGVRSRRARFGIYHGLYPPKVSFIIEIVGPNVSSCLEKITIGSADVINEPVYHLYPYQMTQNLMMKAALKVNPDETRLRIPLFCEQMDDHILITYIPLFAGEHTIGIVWQGRYIINSPYICEIEETDYLKQKLNEIGPSFAPGLEYPLCLLKTDQKFDFDSIGIVTRKKTLKKSIIFKNKEYDYKTYMAQLQKEHELLTKETSTNQLPTIETNTTNTTTSTSINSPNIVITEEQEDNKQSKSSLKAISSNSEDSRTVSNAMNENQMNVGNDSSATVNNNNNNKQKSFRKMLMNNNETLKKELNEIGKNFKEKLKRHHNNNNKKQ